MSINFTYEFLETDDDGEEYLTNIDENGKITKIPYNPFIEVLGLDNYMKLIKENKFKEAKNKFLNFDRHWDEVEKIEDAEELLIVYLDDGSIIYDLKKIKDGINQDYVKSIENENTKVYYVKYNKNQNLRKKRSKNN